MNKFFIVLSCLPFAAHGLRVQTPSDSLHRLLVAKNRYAGAKDNTSLSLQKNAFAGPSVFRRLAMLFARKHLIAFSFATLKLHADVCYVVAPGHICRSCPFPKACLFRPESVRRAANTAAMDSVMTATDHVMIFGRIADKMFVEKPEDIQGTAASGYEFGTLEAGRPKWLCTYMQRSGKTQGGGSEVDHAPNWQGLFGDGKSITKAELADALSNFKFAMPLGAPYGAKPAAADRPSDAAIDAFWRLMGGSEDNAELCAETASKALSVVAKGKDSLTFPAFSEAMEQA